MNYSTMNLLTGLLGYFLLICYIQELTLAAPTHVKRDQEYRNVLFDEYGCRINKAAEAVRAKLHVSCQCQLQLHNCVCKF